ncbi:MAG TPA: cupin domain-containing protein [Puia sp.]|nr:cupin domain-containing protein [Puia sp.]
MEQVFPYVTRLDIKFDALQTIDINEMVRECTDKWFNQTLTKVNDSVVRVGIVEGEYHWHKHDKDDEFFFVLSGQLFVDLEDRTIELNPNQGVTVPHGVVHRTRAPQKTVMLMVETIEIQPTGD